MTTNGTTTQEQVTQAGLRQRLLAGEALTTGDLPGDSDRNRKMLQNAVLGLKRAGYDVEKETRPRPNGGRGQHPMAYRVIGAPFAEGAATPEPQPQRRRRPSYDVGSLELGEVLTVTSLSLTPEGGRQVTLTSARGAIVFSADPPEGFPAG